MGWMDKDPAALDNRNIQKLLDFIGEYDNDKATWENATAFLDYLRFRQRSSLARINRQYLRQLYEKYKTAE